MPTVLRDGPYSFVFFSSDEREPAHIHVKREKWVAKYWLAPVMLARNEGFRHPELRVIERLVERHRLELQEAWNDYFSA
jgi:hypothetical protein